MTKSAAAAVQHLARAVRRGKGGPVWLSFPPKDPWIENKWDPSEPLEVLPVSRTWSLWMTRRSWTLEGTACRSSSTRLLKGDSA